MYKLKFTSAVIALVLSSSASASLIGRDLDGNLSTAEAYYDDVANLTWLADANYAFTSGYTGVNATGGQDSAPGNIQAGGQMGWAAANAWVSSLTIGEVGGWRLADTVQPDASCSSRDLSYQYYYGYCSGSEMGNLFFNVLGGVAGQSILTTHNANYDLFSNIQSYLYWSNTEIAFDTGYAWTLNMGTGYQAGILKDASLYAWAVQSGDVGNAVSAVPVPAAIWLFGSGLIGLIEVARRKAI